MRRIPMTTANPRHFLFASMYLAGSFSPNARLTMAVAATPTAMERLMRRKRVVVAAPMAVRASSSRCWTKLVSRREFTVWRALRATAGQARVQTVRRGFS